MSTKSSDSPTVFFHLGLPKTASTYLQHLVFPYLEGLRFFPKKYHKNFEKHIQEYQGKECVLLFSVEEDLWLRKRMEMIASYDPNIRVILVFRRHDSWLKSKYKYFIRKHGYASFEEFLDMEIHPNGIGGRKGLSYRTKIEWAEELFTQPPLVFIYENLKKNPAVFIKDLANLTGTKIAQDIPVAKRVNTAFTDHQLRWLRKYNRWAKFKHLKREHTNKIWKFVHDKGHQLGLHTVARVARMLPERPNDELIPDELLEEIKVTYTEDWKFCVAYAEESKKIT